MTASLELRPFKLYAWQNHMLARSAWFSKKNVRLSDLSSIQGTSKFIKAMGGTELESRWDLEQKWWHFMVLGGIPDLRLNLKIYNNCIVHSGFFQPPQHSGYFEIPAGWFHYKLSMAMVGRCCNLVAKSVASEKKAWRQLGEVDSDLSKENRDHIHFFRELRPKFDPSWLLSTDTFFELFEFVFLHWHSFVFLWYFSRSRQYQCCWVGKEWPESCSSSDLNPAEGRCHVDLSLRPQDRKEKRRCGDVFFLGGKGKW